MIKLKQIVEGKDSKNAAGIAYFFDNTMLCCLTSEGRWGIPKGHIHIDETPICIFRDGYILSVLFDHAQNFNVMWFIEVCNRV